MQNRPNQVTSSEVNGCPLSHSKSTVGRVALEECGGVLQHLGAVGMGYYAGIPTDLQPREFSWAERVV
jgi:hypothetical protein